MICLWPSALQGDVAETVVTYFQQSSGIKPSPTSTLTLEEVDQFLDSMTLLTREEEQVKELKVVTRRYGTFSWTFHGRQMQ